MFVNLVKMKKNLIYLLIFLFFNCIFINSLKADINHEDAEATNAEFSLSYGITFDDDGDKMYIVGTDPGFKNIVVQRQMTLFLLLGVGLFFVSIIQFTYETMAICCILYLVMIPVSIFNYRSKLKNSQNEIIEEDQRDIL